MSMLRTMMAIAALGAMTLSLTVAASAGTQAKRTLTATVGPGGAGSEGARGSDGRVHPAGRPPFAGGRTPTSA